MSTPSPDHAREDPAVGPVPGVRPDHTVVTVHRIGAVVVALVIAVFGVLGFAGGLAFFDTSGRSVVGLSTNGLLSTVSLVTAAVLLLAAVRGGRLSSTVMIVIGTLFLISAFVNLGLINTPYNLLAFRLPNVFFSIGAGLVLLVLGAYGRVSSKLPVDNPYYLDKHPEEAGPADPTEGPADAPAAQLRPRSNAEHEADREMAEASRALASGTASDAQRRRLEEIDAVRSHEERRERWMAASRRGDAASGGGRDDDVTMA